MAAAAPTAAAAGAAAAAVGTTNTFLTAFFRLDDIPDSQSDNYHQNSNNNYIFHIYFLPLRAYSAFSFLSALTHR